MTNPDPERGRQATTRPRGILIVSILMILFGILEIWTGFTHNFVGISTSASDAATFAEAAIGSFYAIAGILILTMRYRAAVAAIALLLADIAGRLSLVASGLYPLDSTENATGIIGGTAIASIFAIYIWSRRSAFRKNFGAS